MNMNIIKYELISRCHQIVPCSFVIASRRFKVSFRTHIHSILAYCDYSEKVIVGQQQYLWATGWKPIINTPVLTINELVPNREQYSEFTLLGIKFLKSDVFSTWSFCLHVYVWFYMFTMFNCTCILTDNLGRILIFDYRLLPTERTERWERLYWGTWSYRKPGTERVEG